MKTELYRFSARRNIVSAAECREEVVERFLVGQIDNRKAQAPLVVVPVKQVVVADGEVEQIPGLDARRIMVIVFGSRCRYLYEG